MWSLGVVMSEVIGCPVSFSWCKDEAELTSQWYSFLGYPKNSLVAEWPRLPITIDPNGVPDQPWPFTVEHTGVRMWSLLPALLDYDPQTRATANSVCNRPRVQ